MDIPAALSFPASLHHLQTKSVILSVSDKFWFQTP